MQTYDLFEIIGPRMVGPSSSHTMGPRFAAEAFKATLEQTCATRVRITLYGSARTTAAMLDAIAMLTEEESEQSSVLKG